MIQWKRGCRSRKQKRKIQPIARPGIENCHWFILLATPTMQFSLDRKRRSHKRNQRSASDSVGLIFTRSYHFTLLITTPTTTPSLVKTSLKRAHRMLSSHVISGWLLKAGLKSRSSRTLSLIPGKHWGREKTNSSGQLKGNFLFWIVIEILRRSGLHTCPRSRCLGLFCCHSNDMEPRLTSC